MASAPKNKISKVPANQLMEESNVRKLRPRNKSLGIDSTKASQKGNSSLEGSNSSSNVRVSRKTRLLKQHDPASSDTKLRTQSKNTCCSYHRTTLSPPSSMQNWLDYRWNEYARCLKARVLLQKSKCMTYLSGTHEGHKHLHQALSVLKLGNQSTSSLPISHSFCQLECLALRESLAHPLEEECLLYHLSVLSLRQMNSTIKSEECCHFSSAGVFEALIWLYRAFTLCREASPLFCKVARLLAILHVPSELGGFFELPINDGLQTKRTGPFFHQLSLGATARQQHLAILEGKKLPPYLINLQARQSCSLERMHQALRILPLDLSGLESIAQEGCQLPCSTVCMSLVDHEIQSIINGQSKSSEHSWLLLSRFDADSEPVSMILSCPSLPESAGICCSPYDIGTSNEAASNADNAKTPFSELTSRLNSILEESRQSTSEIQVLNSVLEKSKWWEWRMDLDARLASLLRATEESWLGPWKCFLLGKLSRREARSLEKCVKGIKERLESMIEASHCINVSLVQLLLQATGCLTREELKEGVMQLLGVKEESTSGFIGLKPLQDSGSNLLHGDLIDKATNVFVKEFRMLVGKVEQASEKVAMQMQSSHVEWETLPRNLSEDFMKADVVDLHHREPVVVVLDPNTQVFPWESLPTFRSKEVYRMPSLGCMKALVIQRGMLEGKRTKCHGFEDAYVSLGETVMPPSLPSIDPCNTYFVLNPSGDLTSTQAAFEDWFKCQQGWVGKVGQIPTAEECMIGLQTFDLFVYIGHGSGDQYFSEKRLKKMDCFAAALLMGCSSGRLFARGDYEPLGVPWSYLMAGCPSAIANLWDVTDGDIDRFSRSLLHVWLNSDLSEFEERKICDESKLQKGLPTGPSISKNVSSVNNGSLSLKARVASHMGDGRNSCRLPYLIGASPVCYGIPTFVKKKISS